MCEVAVLSAFKARVTLAVLSEFKPRHSRSVDGGSAASWTHGFSNLPDRL